MVLDVEELIMPMMTPGLQEHVLLLMFARMKGSMIILEQLIMFFV